LGTANTKTDFDIHGLVGLSLRGASPGDIRSVRIQLGIAPSELTRTPDVTIQFVPRIEVSSALCRIGSGKFGFTEGGFFVCDTRRNRPAARLPMDCLGGPCEILCESGTAEVPLLLPIVHLTAFGAGAVPLHASAGVIGGTGFVMTGWSGGGKTGMLLALMTGGGQLVSDDWTYLTPDGRQILGLPQRMEIRQAYLAQLPVLRKRIGFRQRARIAVARCAAAVAHLANSVLKGRTQPSQAIQRLGRILETRQRAKADPAELFGEQACVYRGPSDMIVLTEVHDDKNLVVQQATAGQFIEKLALLTEAEMDELIDAYRKFRFAFPGAGNPRLNGFSDRLREQLRVVLSGRSLHIVRHPSPASISQMQEALKSLLPRQPDAIIEKQVAHV
jgi:hypothetical protein